MGNNDICKNAKTYLFVRQGQGEPGYFPLLRMSTYTMQTRWSLVRKTGPIQIPVVALKSSDHQKLMKDFLGDLRLVSGKVIDFGTFFSAVDPTYRKSKKPAHWLLLLYATDEGGQKFIISVDFHFGDFTDYRLCRNAKGDYYEVNTDDSGTSKRRVIKS